MSVFVDFGRVVEAGAPSGHCDKRFQRTITFFSYSPDARSVIGLCPPYSTPPGTTYKEYRSMRKTGQAWTDRPTGLQTRLPLSLSSVVVLTDNYQANVFYRLADRVLVVC